MKLISHKLEDRTSIGQLKKTFDLLCIDVDQDMLMHSGPLG